MTNVKCLKKIPLVILLAVMSFIFCFGKAGKARAEQNAGESGYISLHEYLSPTEIPNVYRVTMTITPQIKPVLTDIVIVVNEGHNASRVAVLRNSGSLPAAPFGYKLDINGNTTSTVRRYSSSGYTIFDVELFSAEQIIRKLADPTINPNYANTRIAMVSYGVGGGPLYRVLNRSGLVSLEDENNVKFLLSKIGIMDTQSYSTGNPVPLAKSTQQAYQILEDPSVPLFFNFTSPGFTIGDNQLNYPGGATTTGDLTHGMWQAPVGTTIDDYSSVNKYIVSLHCIGASMPNQSGGINYTLYPLKTPSSPTNVTTNAATALPANQQETKYDFPAYDAARYAIKMASDNLKGTQKEKVFHSFTFWVDPSNLSDTNSYAWLDFNQTISAFPLSATPIIPGSGYTSPSSTRQAMLFNTYVAPSQGFSYENWEGVQYWSDAAQTHNIRDYDEFDPEISSLVEQFSSNPKNAIVRGKIDSRFEIYKFPGASQFQILTSEDVDPTITGGTVTYSNKELTWNIGNLPIQGTLSLIYYVSFDTSDTDADVSYKLSDMVLEYDYEGNSQHKSFPDVYIQGGEIIESTSTDDAKTMDRADSQTKTDASAIGLISGASMPVYTPSVTPQKNKIENEKLEEKNEEIPVTKTPMILAVALLVALTSGTVLTLRLRKNKK